MTSPPSKPGRDGTTPFLVQLFYRTGSFVRPDEFGTQHLPPHVPIYTWSDCSLKELAFELAATRPTALPVPAAGTRLAFQLVYPDLRNVNMASGSEPRFAVKDLGSVILGERTPGVEVPDDVEMGGRGAETGAADKNRTLNDARFVVGDYLSCAILPPLSDGAVAPAPSMRRESNLGAPGGRGGYGGGYQSRENGRGGPRPGRGGWRENVGSGFPMGDWRRGERLPDGPGPRSRGRGRW